MSFAVLQTRLEKLAGAQLAPMLGLNRELMYTVGTTKRGRDYSGILTENLTEERAKRLVAELQAVGVDSEVRDMAAMVPNPRAFQVRNADCTVEGFKVQDLYGRERVHPWNTVVLLSAGRVVFEKTVTKETTTGPSAGTRIAGAGIFLATGIPVSGMMGRSQTEKTSVVKKESQWVLDVYTLSDSPHYRIVGAQFNYDYLGPRQVTASRENFLLLLGDFAQQAASAVRNQWFDALFAGQEMNSIPEYVSLRAFDEENRWRLQRLKSV